MAQTPNPSRRSWVGPAPMPFLTPRAPRRHLEMRWADGGSHASVRRSGVGAVASSGDGERDRAVNVQVVLRCRPLNEEEQRLDVKSVISCNDTNKEVTARLSLFKQPNRTFTFDKVFGPESQQSMIFDHAVAPLVNDVLEGYNCTVFAFGQTGTGKTYTMEGEMKQKVSELPDTAGVIPRAVRHIFDRLEKRKDDYSMKVTFLELYNEEITDLLALEDQSRYPEDRHKRPITLMEDGKGGAVIRGLEEIVVYSPGDIYGLLEHGSARRRTAGTALNKQSSRSHAVFSINIHVKETTVGNEEFMRCGRLNLVDLAGSENIDRSGAREGRAREAGEVNKSLLTLGRVITALVEHSVHVPYRDSKLTRLLRESLGGKAKTCIIATVSPSVHSLEETMATLDYASRAKSIRNKPEANKKTCKSVMLKDLYQEMERMKQDVKASREKNGIYIPHGRFIQDEEEKKTMREKMEHLELSLEKQIKEAEKFKGLYLTEQECRLDFESRNKDLKVNLESWKGKFLDLQEANCRAKMSLREKDFVISNLLHSEHLILERAKDMRNTLENATGDITVLLNKLAMMVSEAEQVLNDILESTLELKKLLAFSAELQQAGLKRSLTSAQAMSKTSIDFFEDIRIHEEQSALNKITKILSALTAQKTTMVSAFMGQLNERYCEEQKHLKLEMTNLQQVSDNGKNESLAYVGAVESQFQEDMSSHAQLNDQMEGILQQCLKKGGHSVSYWSHTQSSLHDLCMGSIMEVDDFIEERSKENENMFQEKQLFSSQNDAEFHAITSDVLTASKNSLILDHETRNMIETASTTSSDRLELLNEKHSAGAESIRNMANNCLEKDYMANSPIRHRPRELLTKANSLESLEELRASVPDLEAKFRSENHLEEMEKGKQYSDQRTRTPRSPLMPVNKYVERRT
ncbi:hypothetical protein U9M48_007012 [Paspalum notatum var. saurae]|uniref:Kinesin-like protein n=1 Tax=Paspalum notatum var. saurae TaxID=547442 RepID=A0AAQ3SME5_PASNO